MGEAWGTLHHSELWKGEEGLGPVLSVVMSICSLAHLWILISKRVTPGMLSRCFMTFFLPVFSSHLTVWNSACTSHLSCVSNLSASCMQPNDPYRSKNSPCEMSATFSHIILLSSRYLWLTLFCHSNRLCSVSSQNNWRKLLFYVQMCVT